MNLFASAGVRLDLSAFIDLHEVDATFRTAIVVVIRVLTLTSVPDN
jgi:hypothetical protein